MQDENKKKKIIEYIFTSSFSTAPFIIKTITFTSPSIKLPNTFLGVYHHISKLPLPNFFPLFHSVQAAYFVIFKKKNEKGNNLKL